MRELEESLFPEDEYYDIGNAIWWLLWDGKDAVGYCGVRMYADSAYLARAALLPEFRGRGLQRRMVQAREKYAVDKGIKLMLTDTVATNPASMNTLIRCGYKTFVPEEQWKYAGAIYWRKHL